MTIPPCPTRCLSAYCGKFKGSDCARCKDHGPQLARKKAIAADPSHESHKCALEWLAEYQSEQPKTLKSSLVGLI